jgi:hypothetical protein
LGLIRWGEGRSGAIGDRATADRNTFEEGFPLESVQGSSWGSSICQPRNWR